MCFITKDSELKIATKDIECYKVGIVRQEVFNSEFQCFSYKYDRVYLGKSIIKIFLKWLFNIPIGAEGYHSYINTKAHPYLKCVKCIIPKGSLYLRNYNYGEYCSTSIIIKKRIRKPSSTLYINL